MASTLIFVHYSGHWESEKKYTGYKTCGILLNDDCSYEQLHSKLVETLEMNPSTEIVSMKYQVNDTYPPITINDDKSLQFYKELKKRETDHTRFPICTTLEKLNYNLTLQPNQNIEELEEFPYTIEPLQLMPLRICGKTESQTHREYAEKSSNALAIHIEETMEKIVNHKHSSEVKHIDNRDTNIYPGQTFEDKQQLKHTLSMYAIKHHFQYMVVKSCPKQYTIKCIDESCPWNLKASSIGGTPIFKVRSMKDIHKCALGKRMNNKRQATASVVSSCIKDKFDNLKTHYTPADVIRDMHSLYKVDLSYKRAWRARRKALEAVQGNPYKSYQLIPGYLQSLSVSNPGSFVKLKTTENNIFEYVFLSLKASIEGWKYCRPIIVVDGTFLKATYGGTLITASTQDAASHILPLAYGVVDSENNKAYEWFFENLKSAISEREGLCFVSDQHPSIKFAINKVYPNAAHCNCIYHMSKTIARKYKINMEAVKEGFMAAAKAYTEYDFNRHMGAIEKADPRVIAYLEDEIGVERWSRMHCKSNRFLTMTSNVAETINSSMKVARELPITLLLECLRGMQQEWNVKNKAEANGTFTKLAKLGHKMLEENYKASMHLTVQKATDEIFKVSNGPRIFIVDIGKKTCSCNRFQMDELPCAHALCVIRGIHEEPEPYCSRYYYTETMVATYSEAVYPVDYETTRTPPTSNEDCMVIPPPHHSQCGRRRKERFSSSWEKGCKKGTCQKR